MSAKCLSRSLFALVVALSLPISADELEASTGILALNQSETSIPRGNMIYTSLVVGLQHQIRDADQRLSSLAVDKKFQPDWSDGFTALDRLVEIVDDPSLKTVIVVDAEKEEFENTIQIQLSYAFYDTETASVYRHLRADASINKDNCNQICLTEKFKTLSQSLVSSVVASLKGSVPTQELALVN